MIGRKLRADRAVTVFLFDVGGAADKLLRRLVVCEQGGVAPDIGGRAVHDLVVAEFRHLRNFNTVYDTVPDGDLGVRKGFAKRQAEGAKADVDIAFGAGVEIAGQRPVAGPDQKRGIHNDQERCADDGLGSKVQPQNRESSLESKCHEISPVKYAETVTG
jgi:hypothetical protein